MVLAEGRGDLAKLLLNSPGRALLGSMPAPVLHALVLEARDCEADIVLAPNSANSQESLTDLAKRIGATRLIWADHVGPPHHLDLCEEATPKSTSGIGLYTSGTTGLPKLVLHDWHSISAPAQLVPERLRARRWLMTYGPRTYAGLQVLLSATHSGGTVEYTPAEPHLIPEFIVERGVDVISATPSWWRRLLISWPSDVPKPQLFQATLGGEPVGQDILTAIDASFRPRTLTHVYASSEAGAAIAVSDRRAGFPLTWLAKEGPVRVRVVDDQLEIWSEYSMRGYESGAATGSPRAGWWRTPDLAELIGDRVYIRGRSDGIINVGGTKVSPDNIEEALRSLPGVMEACVFAKSNPITGSLLAAEVVPTPGHHVDIAAIQRGLSSLLPAPLRPRVIRVVDLIQLTSTGKKQRVR